MGLNKNKNVSINQIELDDLFRKVNYFNFTLSTVKNKNLQLQKGKNGFFNWGFIFRENPSNKPTTYFQMKNKILSLNHGILTIKGKIVDREDENYKMSIEEDTTDLDFGFLGYNKTGDNVILELKPNITKTSKYYEAQAYAKIEREGQLYSIQYEPSHRLL